MTGRCELSHNDNTENPVTASLQISNWCENEDNTTMDNSKQGSEGVNDLEYSLELVPNFNEDAHSLIVEGTSQTRHDNRIENLAANNVGTINVGDWIIVNGNAEFTGNIGGSVYQKRLKETLEKRSDCTKNVFSPNKISHNEQLSPKDILRNNTKRILIVLLVIILLSLIIAVLRHFVVNFPSSYIENYENSTELVTETAPKSSFYIFTVLQWGGRVISNEQNLTKPATLVIIKHTNTGICLDLASCFTSMQTLQGGDGNIYVGRGWGVRNTQIDGSVDISFMGDFDVEKPNDIMLNAGKYLVGQGIQLGYLDKENLRIVAHNQTEKTNSPGMNIYKEIISWKYYSSDIII